MKIKQFLNRLKTFIHDPTEIGMIIKEFELDIKHKDYDKIDIPSIEKAADIHSGSTNDIKKYAYMTGVLIAKIEDIKETLF